MEGGVQLFKHATQDRAAAAAAAEKKAALATRSVAVSGVVRFRPQHLQHSNKLA
jgi:hypothetical protein